MAQALPSTKALYQSAQVSVDRFIMETNKEFVERQLPMRVDSLTTVWTVLFKTPGRYHWMFQVRRAVLPVCLRARLVRLVDWNASRIRGNHPFLSFFLF